MRSQTWDIDEKMLVEKSLQKIWDKAGIIEIKGGAESGKSFLIILLAKFLKGKVWTNIPNNLSGCQKLYLETIQQIYNGHYPQGMTGQNNVILIDDSWDFFSKKELEKHGLSHHKLSDMFFFLSETSKTGIKFFYVTKQGVKLPEAFNILSANRSGEIRTLGKRYYCRFLGKKYYYLDIQFPAVGGAKSNSPQNRKARQNLWFWQRLGESGIISVPFTQDDYKLYDRAWNQDKIKAQNRVISYANQAEADELTEILGHKLSRRQRLDEEAHLEAYIKKFMPEIFKEKAFALLRKRGWKPGHEKLALEEKELEKKWEQGELAESTYNENKVDLAKRKAKYEEIMNKKGKKVPVKSVPEEIKKEPVNFTPQQNSSFNNYRAKPEAKKELNIKVNENKEVLTNNKEVVKKPAETKPKQKTDKSLENFIKNYRQEDNKDDEDEDEKDPDDEGEN